MNELKLRLFVNAYKIRMQNGETVEEIENSYPKLTVKEKNSIKSQLNKEI